MYGFTNSLARLRVDTTHSKPNKSISTVIQRFFVDVICFVFINDFPFDSWSSDFFFIHSFDLSRIYCDERKKKTKDKWSLIIII